MHFKEMDVTEGSVTRYFHWLNEQLRGLRKSRLWILNDDTKNTWCHLHSSPLITWDDDDDDTVLKYCEKCLSEAESEILVLRKEYWTGLDEDEVSNEEIIDVDIESIDDSNV